jgi:hypothetical protein
VSRISWFKEIGQMDRRAIALFHPLLLSIILYDAISRLSLVGPVFGPSGFLPKSLFDPSRHILFGGLDTFNFSAFGIFDSELGNTILFSLSAALPLVMIFSYRRPWMYWLLIYLRVSANIRYSFTLNGGDNHLTWLLVYAAFLPQFQHLNAVADRPKEPYVKNLPIVLLTLYLVAFYFGAGVSKTGWRWHEGIALQVALQWDAMATGKLDWLIDFPALTKASSFAVKYLEILAGLFLLTPARFVYVRTAFVLIYWALHFAMSIGLNSFPLPQLGFITWMLFLPAPVWDWLDTKISFAQWHPLPTKWIFANCHTNESNTFSQLALPVLFVLNIASGIGTTGVKALYPIKRFATKIGLRSNWDFFSPNLPGRTSYFVLKVRNSLGENFYVDPMSAQLGRPKELIPETYHSFRAKRPINRIWSKFYRMINYDNRTRIFRKGPSNFVCFKMEDITDFKVEIFRYRIGKGGVSLRRVIPFRGKCGKRPKKPEQ